ncbi:hypothetical protein F4781DRAFT_384681 [Annulohypoxylon bovei var. microspora]|nr:hypothetical protein F4781DRAFT_384681 [Annulohypoxylon bovei var. microspora]
MNGSWISLYATGMGTNGICFNTAFGYIPDHTHGPYQRYQGWQAYDGAPYYFFAYSERRPGKALEGHACFSCFYPPVARLPGLISLSPSIFTSLENKKDIAGAQASARARACLCLHIRADYQAHGSRAEDSPARSPNIQRGWHFICFICLNTYIYMTLG